MQLMGRGTLILNSTKRLFNMQGEWYSPNMTPTMVHSQNFGTIVRQ
jgi:hypothetical protein